MRITEFSVTEDAHDPNLNPIRAKVSLGLRVLSYSDLQRRNPAWNLFLAHQVDQRGPRGDRDDQQPERRDGQQREVRLRARTPGGGRHVFDYTSRYYSLANADLHRSRRARGGVQAPPLPAAAGVAARCSPR